MKMIDEVNGLGIVELMKFEDLRGELLKTQTDSYIENTQFSNFVAKETWFTFSNINVIRAMHFQMGEFPSKKIISPIKGKFLDAILDLRPESATFLKTFSIVLEAESPKTLFIPQGCAHGYRVLADNSIMLYQADEVHSQKDDIGILWSSFGFNWGLTEPIISDRDKNLPPLDSYIKSLSLGN